MFNSKLMNACNQDDFKKLGFIEKTDGTGDPRGVWWAMDTTHFHLTIDCAFEVNLTRRNPDTDEIIIHVEDLTDLEGVVNFIQD